MNDRQLDRRMERVRVLLRTRHDYLPSLRSSLDPPSGIVEGKNVPCPDCRSTGMVGNTKAKCPVCGGRGWRRRRAGEQAWDEMVREPVSSVDDDRPARAATLQELEASLSAIAAVFAEREGRYDQERFGWEVARQARDASGSYQELERWLAVMRERFPMWSAAIERTYTDGLLEEGATQAEVLGVRWLAESMRPPIRIPDWAFQEETERLVNDIRAAKKRGLSVSEISREHGVSQRRIRALLDRSGTAA